MLVAFLGFSGFLIPGASGSVRSNTKVPLANATNLTVAENTLQNYMGLPKGTFLMAQTPITALPFRAYNLIWNEWFRDQNLQNSIPVDKDDGPEDLS